MPTNNVIAFTRMSSESEPCVDTLTTLAHELAQESENIRFDAPHAQQRLSERNISIRQVLEVLRKGKCVSGPKKDKYGDWRIKLRAMVAGKRVQVVIVVKENYLEVITAM